MYNTWNVDRPNAGYLCGKQCFILTLFVLLSIVSGEFSLSLQHYRVHYFLFANGNFSQAVGSQEAATDTVMGEVYNDYNQDGVRGLRETGIAGVKVTAYGAQNSVVASALTAAQQGSLGHYMLKIPDGTGPIRLAFSNFGPASTSPQLLTLQPSNHRAGTVVSFIQNPHAGAVVNFALARPADYCQSNPQLATTCYVNGDQRDAGDHVLVSFPYAADGTQPPPTPLATSPELGSTYSLAYQRASDSIFAAAYIKRHAGLKPSGSTGAIYLVQNASSPHPLVQATPFVDLNHIFGAKTAGANPHNTKDYNLDASAYDAVGKVGLGGLTLSEDEKTLYTVNLADDQLYRIALSAPPAAPVVVGKIKRMAIPIPHPCSQKDFRPFAATAYAGGVYIGAVCSAESTISRRRPLGDATKLAAYVLRYTARGGFARQPVFEFSLHYPRRCTHGSNVPKCWKLFSANWNPWHPQYTATSPNLFPSFPQPMLTSIAFDEGDLILGLRDRYGDQVGWDNPPPKGGRHIFGIATGDVLRACLLKGGDLAAGWRLENNAQCGGITTKGANDGQGPGKGEYYYQDEHLPFHDELGLGSVAQIPGFPTMASTMFNPTDIIDTAGIRTYDNRAGTSVTRYMVYNQDAARTFGKSDGLGGLVPLCQAAPVEIGNRVWHDTNGNGLQDAAEAPLADVTLRLYDSVGGTLLQTTRTDANGEYYFRIDPYKRYLIRLDNASDYTSGPLQHMHLTLPNQLANTAFYSSKAVLPLAKQSPGPANYPQIVVSPHTPGQNDQTLNIGFL